MDPILKENIWEPNEDFDLLANQAPESYGASKAVCMYGLDFCIPLFENFVNSYSKLPIVSVGSGLGYFEFILWGNITYDQSLEWLEFICVDPDPKSFDIDVQKHKCRVSGSKVKFTEPEIFMEPKYTTVNSLIKEKPDIVGNCLLLLNWLPPNNDLESEAFDLEAIKLLQPEGVLCNFGVNIESKFSCAGSKHFFNWMIEEKHEGYESIYESILVPIQGEPNTYVDIRWHWFSKPRENPIHCKLPNIVRSKVKLWSMTQNRINHINKET